MKAKRYGSKMNLMKAKRYGNKTELTNSCKNELIDLYKKEQNVLEKLSKVFITSMYLIGILILVFAIYQSYMFAKSDSTTVTYIAMVFVDVLIVLCVAIFWKSIKQIWNDKNNGINWISLVFISTILSIIASAIAILR